ncbi:MAG: O-methyltransferase [Propionibacteriaceae bacterium]|nr:O-methyltransferase [Propionibacteriaceae bacterium]
MNASNGETTSADNNFVDDFLPESAESLAARRAAYDLGIDPVSQATANLLTLLTRSIHATTIAEIGTGTGVSTLAFFAGMGTDGAVTSVDREVEHQMIARTALKAAGVAHTRYRLITEDALSVLPKLRSHAYDLVFIDADSLDYPEFMEEALRIVRPGGLIVMNHVLLGGRVADLDNLDDDTIIMRDTLEVIRGLDGLTSALLPVGDGLIICSPVSTAVGA